MPFVRRHVTRRLKAAKAECDKELQRVTNNITTFFEERLREGDHETERDREQSRGRDRDSQLGDPDALVLSADFGSAVQTDESSSDGGYEAEVDYGYGHHNRQRTYLVQDEYANVQTLTHCASFPRLNAVSSGSQRSPGSLRRQNTLPWDRPLSSSASSSVIALSPAPSTIVLPEAPITRKQTNAPAPTSWGTGGSVSRRLSRTIHIPAHHPRSGQSSRSTSRSRSPLPPLSTHASFSDIVSSGSSTTNRRSSRILVDDPVDPIMTALYDIIGVATDITEMSVAQLTSQPKICESLVQRVQNIGKAWDDHPDWHGRNWYVQVLLAVASLSRVVEWWEAEKQFWNFDDNDDEQDEPLTFVMKPADEEVALPSPSKQLDAELESFRLNDDDESKPQPMRPAVLTRKSRDEQPKDLSATATTPPREIFGVHPRVLSGKENTESARVLATERLRLQAETAHNQNIVIELSLDGDHFIWINHAWRVVVG
jgi:serine/threonine-protein kinase RIM15